MSKSIETTVIGKGSFLQLLDRQTFEFVDRPNTAGVAELVALTDDGKILLVEQFRHASSKNVIELIGDDVQYADEPAFVAAARELEEETGYHAGNLIEAARGGSSRGHSTEMIVLFLATNLTKVSKGGGVDGEKIVVHETPLKDVHAWIEFRRAEGVEIGIRVYAGLYFAHWHIEKLGV